MSNLQAAVGLAQVERAAELVADKRRVFQHYAKAFKDFRVTINPEPAGTINGYWMPTLVIDEDADFDRAALINELKTNNVDARVFFWPLTMMDFFKDRENRQQPIAYRIYKHAINLPSYHGLIEDDLNRVINITRKYLIHA